MMHFGKTFKNIAFQVTNKLIWISTDSEIVEAKDIKQMHGDDRIDISEYATCNLSVLGVILLVRKNVRVMILKILSNLMVMTHKEFQP